jgi:DNA-binding FrmR family transcriptional regulator
MDALVIITGRGLGGDAVVAYNVITALEKKCVHCQKKDRTEEEIKDLITRLNRIEGQIRGIRKMIEEDAYCVDILTQVSAARCSLNSFSKVLLGNHIKTCVADDIRNGSDEKTEELVELLQKLMK